MIYLQTPRLIIRDQKPEDADTYFALFSNKQALYYWQSGYPETIEKAKEQIDNEISKIGKENRQNYFLRIEDKQNNEHIGEIGYSVEENTPIGKLVGMGYFIYPKFWSKGYTTEAAKEVIRFAFEENNVFRIAASCFKDNIGSEKVMIKCGMIKEAERKSCTWHDGQIKDRVSYRLLKSEWTK